MFGKLWWLFAVLVILVDLINPFVGLFGVAFGVISLFILGCFMIVLTGYVKKIGTAGHMRLATYLAALLVWGMGVILRPGVFTLASGLLTGTRKPAGFIFLWPESLEFIICVILVVISVILQSLMCLAIVINAKNK